MFEEKESFWKKKGFYLSVCTAIVCVLAIGTVYYKMNYKKDNGQNLFADSATSSPVATSSTTGGSAINSSGQQEAGTNNNEASVSVAQNNNVQGIVTSKPADNVPEETPDVKNTTQKEKDTKKTDKAKEKPVTKTITQNKTKNKEKEVKKAENPVKSAKKQTDNKTVAAMSETGVKNKFDMEKGLLWPVSGDVILKFSMGNTVYFQTLAQYKCNPAVIIASEEGTNVKEAAGGTVTKVTHSDELGNIVTVDIGSGYTLTYGQLKDISVKEGQEIKEGDIIGKVAKPTKYYSKEGSNLYLQVMEKDNPVDPLLLLR